MRYVYDTAEIKHR